MLLRPISLSAACAVLVVGCSTPEVGIEPRFSPFQIEGSLSVGSSPTSASRSVDELGLDEDSVKAGGRIDLEWGSPHFSASYTPNSFQGESVLSAPISLGGTTIGAGASVESDLELDVTSLVLTFDLLPIPNVEVGLGFGLAVIDFDTSLQDVASGTAIETNETLPVPVLAGRLGWDIWRFQVALLVSGISYASNGQSVSYYDLDAELRFNFIGHESRLQGWVSAGYRQIGTDFSYNDAGARIDSDLTLKGPFLGLVLGF